MQNPQTFRRAFFLAAAGIVAAGAVNVLRAQAPATDTKPPAFEVASVKPNKSGSNQTNFSPQPGGRFTATNVSVLQMIRIASSTPVPLPFSNILVLPRDRWLDRHGRNQWRWDYVTTTLRAYNALLDRWELVGTDRGNGLQNIGNGQRVGAEMHLEQKFGVMSPRPSTLRIRYFNIGPDHFSWAADQSTDDGKSWVRDAQQIEARRTEPPRLMGPLAVAGPVSSGHPPR